MELQIGCAVEDTTLDELCGEVDKTASAKGGDEVNEGIADNIMVIEATPGEHGLSPLVVQTKGWITLGFRLLVICAVISAVIQRYPLLLAVG